MDGIITLSRLLPSYDRTGIYNGRNSFDRFNVLLHVILASKSKLGTFGSSGEPLNIGPNSVLVKIRA